MLVALQKTGDQHRVAGRNHLTGGRGAGRSAAVGEAEFFKNDQLIGTDNEAPHALDWTEAEAGVYQLTAKVTDAKGGTAMTEAVEAAVFDSADYPALGLRLWLDGSTVTQEASKVSAWVDRTPFGHDTSQAEVGQQPAFHSEGINGQPAIVFDGEDDILSGTANGATLLDSTAASLFLVMKQDGGSRNNAVFGWESDGHRNHSTCYSRTTTCCCSTTATPGWWPHFRRAAGALGQQLASR